MGDVYQATDSKLGRNDGPNAIESNPASASLGDR